MNLMGIPPRQKAEKPSRNSAYLAAVASLPCCICQAFGEPQTTPTQAHHTICGRFGSRKTPDEMAIPLCWHHHQGPRGIHSDRAAWVSAYGPDTDWIKPTQDLLAKRGVNV